MRKRVESNLDTAPHADSTGGAPRRGGQDLSVQRVLGQAVNNGQDAASLGVEEIY
ncbi:hypothetical protein [Acrocarpospora catenulata]|uniref:hypothetical protein n=1 Tax=Acrocarpospora catenulata TaxID=2836182 RepID=UPI001BD9430C|nr:hypothetical protein [Acrocarpospora catenulata]